MMTPLKAAKKHNLFYNRNKPNDFLVTRRSIAEHFFNDCVKKIPREIKRRQVKDYAEVSEIVRNIDKEWRYFVRHAKGASVGPEMLKLALQEKYPTMYRIGFEGGPNRWDRIKLFIWRILDFPRKFF